MSDTMQGRIIDADNGGFTAIASTPEMDRDGEIIDARAFEPLPASIPVHADHRASVENLVARAVPTYDRQGRLIINALFASTPDPQSVPQKVLDGIIDSVSVAFFNANRKDVNGITHITSGELLSVDLVTIPSNRSARILSSRAYNPKGRDVVSQARWEALLAQIDVELADARAVLKSSYAHESRMTQAEVRRFLRSL
jgi:hypothetical protein